jgi:RimJ/RimL family protein N-acetyltransferase
MVKRLAKVVLGAMLSDYRINILMASRNISHYRSALPVDTVMKPVTNNHVNQLTKSQTHKMRNSVSYTKAGLRGYVLLKNDMPVCVAHFACSDQYDRMTTWPLKTNEVALMDIATEKTAQGQGYATALIKEATNTYHTQDVSRVIAFIWWSNHPSLRAFAKAGWHRIGISLEVNIGGIWRGFRLPLKGLIFKTGS